jgi:hypothetical protein
MARICTIVSHDKVELKRRQTGEEELVPCLGTEDHVVDLAKLQKEIASYNKAINKIILPYDVIICGCQISLHFSVVRMITMSSMA